MGVNLFQYKTQHITKSADNQIFRFANQRFDLPKTWFTIFCYHTFSVEK